MSERNIQRKCRSCGTWNQENQRCIHCAELLDPELIQEKREKHRKPTWERKETAFDRFIDRWKNHPFVLLRWLYHFLYALGLTFFAIASFFAWLAASPNG